MGEHMLALAGQLLAAYPILFVCPPTAKGQWVLERARQLGCQVLALEVRGDPAAAAVLRKQLRARGVQVFHCHAGIGWEGHAGVYAARAAGVPVVVRSEHLPYLLTDPHECQAYREVVQVVDRVICVSREVYNTHAAAGVPPEKLHVVRNGIVARTPTPDRVGVRARFGLAPEAKIVLTVARMTDQKGHAYLLAAVPTILAEVPEAHFIWVGDGPLEGALRQQMEQLGVAPSHLIFAGRRSDVPDLLAACDLFVLPSVYEGLPLVVLEALANGAPVVGTRVCGTSEAIEDGITGRLVPARDSAALAAAVVEALTQPALVERWRRAGRARIAGEFHVRRMAGEVVAIYEALAGRETDVPGQPGYRSIGGQHGQGADWFYWRGWDSRPACQ